MRPVCGLRPSSIRSRRRPPSRPTSSAVSPARIRGGACLPGRSFCQRPAAINRIRSPGLSPAKAPPVSGSNPARPAWSSSSPARIARVSRSASARDQASAILSPWPSVRYSIATAAAASRSVPPPWITSVSRSISTPRASPAATRRKASARSGVRQCISSSRAEPTRVSTARSTGPASSGPCSPPSISAISLAPLASISASNSPASRPPRRPASSSTTTVPGSSCSRPLPRSRVNCRSVRPPGSPASRSASSPAPVGVRPTTCQSARL